MKITKLQLKRIIREEYSRLKRQGLLREFGMGDVHIEIQNAIVEAIQDITSLRASARGATLEDIELYINNPRSSVKLSSGYVPDYEELAVVVADMVEAGNLMEDAAGFLTLTDGYM